MVSVQRILPFRTGHWAVRSVTNGPIEIPAFGWHIIKKDEASKEDLAKAYKATKSADVSKKS